MWMVSKNLEYTSSCVDALTLERLNRIEEILGEVPEAPVSRKRLHGFQSVALSY